jgi:glycosyltransferase involved in cell wall biosynthesis
MHPHPLSGRRILREELERYPWAKASLLREEELRPNTLRFEELCEEPSLANGWLAASTFTAQTLIENGVPSDAVHRVPYGVDPSEFPARARPRNADQPLEILFLGSMIQRKGLCDLLEAMQKLRSRQVRLTLAGRGYIDTDLLAHYSGVQPTVRQSPTQSELVHLMHQSDLFVLPSLLEGFGHAIVEAMCAGLPIVATPHTCAPDLIQNGVEGWIVPIRSPEALADRLTWAADHRIELAAMGEAAARRARALTWQRFREGIGNSYRAMLSTTTR